MQPIRKSCKNCKHEFWVITHEQEFLQKMNLPLPVNCPGCREARRLSERGERQLYKTTCQNCQKNIIVSYDPAREIR